MGIRNKNIYISRLKKSSPPEVLYRTRQAFFILKLRILLRKKRNPVRVPIIDLADVESLQLPSFQFQVDEDIIEEIIQGRIFSLKADKNVLKRFEEEYCNILFADICRSDSSPDIRTVWEPARLQHITTLLAYILQNPEMHDSKAANKFAKDAVINWIDRNPFLFGPHYISVMECGLRIPVFLYCLKTLNNLQASEYCSILETIYLHAWWISKRLSLYSSLGNHTICECLGLIFGGAVFKKRSEGMQWLEKGFGLLKKELNNQVPDDGGPCEQSFSYHRFVMDIYWLVMHFLEKNRIKDCSGMKQRLLKGEEFLAAFRDDNGILPAIGDSDDGYAVAPGIFPGRPAINRKPKQLEIFKQTGYSVINPQKGVKLTFDHGPLGMAPLYNHGHADALSITLTKNGKGLLVDPGTYRYNGVPEFRRYFKGTRAHNTVTIDGLDQAFQETGFIWGRPYESVLEKSEEKGGEIFIQASHNGYSALKEPVIHKRTLLYFNKTGFVVKDVFSGEGLHTFELNFHLHSDTVCNEEDEWLVIDNQGERIFLKLLRNHSFKFYSGEENPPFGWYSPAYGVKMKSGVLSCLIEGAPEDVSFMTAIGTEAPLEIESIEQKAALI